MISRIAIPSGAQPWIIVYMVNLTGRSGFWSRLALKIYFFKVVILLKNAIFSRIYAVLRRAALSCSVRAFNFY